MTKFFSMFALVLALLLGGCDSPVELQNASIAAAYARPKPEFDMALALARENGELFKILGRDHVRFEDDVKAEAFKILLVRWCTKEKIDEFDFRPCWKVVAVDIAILLRQERAQETHRKAEEFLAKQ